MSKGENGGERLLRPPEAAERLAISTRHLRRLAIRGAIERVRLGAAVRYREADIAELQRVGTR